MHNSVHRIQRVLTGSLVANDRVCSCVCVNGMKTTVLFAQLNN